MQNKHAPNATDLAKVMSDKRQSIHSMLGQLARLSFKEIPNPHWGHAGDLSQIESDLRDILARFDNE